MPNKSEGVGYFQLFFSCPITKVLQKGKLSQIPHSLTKLKSILMESQMNKIEVYSLLLFLNLGLSSSKDSNKMEYINIKDENVISQNRYSGKILEINHTEKQFKIYSSTSEKVLRFKFSKKTEVR